MPTVIAIGVKSRDARNFRGIEQSFQREHRIANALRRGGIPAPIVDFAGGDGRGLEERPAPQAVGPAIGVARIGQIGVAVDRSSLRERHPRSGRHDGVR